MPKVKTEYRFSKNGKRQDKYREIINYQLENQDWENGNINDYITSNKRERNRRWSEGSTLLPLEFAGKKCYAIS